MCSGLTINSVINHDSILKALQKAASEYSISITSFQVETQISTPEVNTCTDVVPVQVEYSCNGKPSTKRLIFKVPFTHPRYDFIRQIGHYDKELDMYANVLPRLNQLLDCHLSPEHYLSAEGHVLVLEDLTASGYRAVLTPYDFQCTVLLLRTVARFHAASYKLHQLDPSSLGMASTETIFRPDFLHKVATKQFALVEGLFRHLHVGQASLKKLQLWKERLMSETPFLAAGESYSMQVLNHGDPKWGNILIKFDGDEPVSAKLIDFQNCRWSSPLNDILYLGTHSIASSVWETQFNDLREAYLEELNLWLTKLGCGRRYEVEDYIHDEELLKPFRINLLLWQLYFEAKPFLNYSTFETQDYGDEVIQKLCQENACKEGCLKIVNNYKKLGIL